MSAGLLKGKEKKDWTYPKYLGWNGFFGKNLRYSDFVTDISEVTNNMRNLTDIYCIIVKLTLSLN